MKTPQLTAFYEMISLWNLVFFLGHNFTYGTLQSGKLVVANVSICKKRSKVCLSCTEINLLSLLTTTTTAMTRSTSVSCSQPASWFSSSHRSL